MLEQATLLLHAWTLDGSMWKRPVTDAAGRSLGFVRFDGDPKSRWFSWLGNTRLDVFETDDASHLMKLTRKWRILGSWEVVDAEERQVGNLYAKMIVTSENIHVGYVDRDHGRILDLQGRAMAKFVRRTPGVLEVTFMREMGTNPFLRMLVLGSIVSIDASPLAAEG